ncbi:MAG: hypothetical protein LQ337_002807 [Flavoplaca oasis]|nr:MAG: hypothetical protein LQ337_002807 [Flavoplaca oasis]
MASPAPSSATSRKRKRSRSVEGPTPPIGVAKPPNYNQLQINYLARQNQDTLPLISNHDSLPVLQDVIAAYDAVLSRHESLAGNLGARPLGPMLLRKFERLFDGPPKILNWTGKGGGNTIGWLGVVEFAQTYPEQFNLQKTKDGVRLCRFFTDQCHVEISEEDYQLISSGMPQKLIPPQPILEDEEKELGTLEILEQSISQVVQLADQVSGRARQINHRLRGRRKAIISRRETEAAGIDDLSARSPASSGHRDAQSNGERMSVSPTSGFVAVNQRTSNQDVHDASTGYADSASLPEPPSARPANSSSMHSASPAIRAELLSKFLTSSERAAAMEQSQGKSSSLTARPAPSGKVKLKYAHDEHGATVSGSPVPIPHTPSNLLPYSKSTPQDRFDDSGPYKSDMMARMEQLSRGDRVQPPCDRCRRLHIDCLKNLTACMGCTRKHAKCSWKDVTEQELIDNPLVSRTAREEAMDTSSGGEVERRSGDPYSDLPTISNTTRSYAKEESRDVRDEEILGEEASGDEDAAHHHQYHPTIPDPQTRLASTDREAAARSLSERIIYEQPWNSASPAKEQDDQTSTNFTAISGPEGKNSIPTNGFQSVNVKGVVVGYNQTTHRDNSEMKSETDQDRERDALVQLSAAAQQVSESQQQQRGLLKDEVEESMQAQ